MQYLSQVNVITNVEVLVEDPVNRVESMQVTTDSHSQCRHLSPLAPLPQQV